MHRLLGRSGLTGGVRRSTRGEEVNSQEHHGDDGRNVGQDQKKNRERPGGPQLRGGLRSSRRFPWRLAEVLGRSEWLLNVNNVAHASSTSEKLPPLLISGSNSDKNSPPVRALRECLWSIGRVVVDSPLQPKAIRFNGVAGGQHRHIETVSSANR